MHIPTQLQSVVKVFAAIVLDFLTGFHCPFFCRNSYHGASSSLLGLLSQSNWKQDVPIGFGQFAVCVIFRFYFGKIHILVHYGERNVLVFTLKLS